MGSGYLAEVGTGRLEAWKRNKEEIWLVGVREEDAED